MKGKWSFDGIDLSNCAWGVEQVLEGLGIPKLRGSNLQVPFEHGKRRIKKRFESRNLVFGMWVRGYDQDEKKVPTGKTLEEQLDINIDYLSYLFGKTGEYTLTRTMGNEETRQAKAEVYNSVDFLIKAPGFARFTVEFELADPFFYNTELRSQTKTISSTDYSWTHNNPGTAPATAAIITLEGPLDSPKLENLNNSIWLKYQGAIEEGETVIINTKDFTCTKDGENYISAIKHGGDAYWLTLEPGNNSLELTTQVTGGSIEIEYYPAYF